MAAESSHKPQARYQTKNPCGRRLKVGRPSKLPRMKKDTRVQGTHLATLVMPAAVRRRIGILIGTEKDL